MDSINSFYERQYIIETYGWTITDGGFIETTSPDLSSPDDFSYRLDDTGKQIYQNSDETYYRQSTNEEIDDLKLLAFAKAFVDVQSYMHKAGNKAIYNKTREIVQSHGLSVKDYTKIALLMNENSDFQNRVQEMINDVN